MRRPMPPISRDDFPAVSESGYRWIDLLRNYTYDLREVQVTLDPTSLTANSTSAEAFTVPGVKVGDYVLHVESATFTDDFTINNAKVTDTDEITLQLHRGKSGGYNPPSETYTFIILKNSRG